MKVEIELPEIDGFEYTGEFNHAAYDDYYLDTDMVATRWGVNYKSGWKSPILRKVQAPPPKPTPSELAELKSAAMLGSDRYTKHDDCKVSLAELIKESISDTSELLACGL